MQKKESRIEPWMNYLIIVGALGWFSHLLEVPYPAFAATVALCISMHLLHKFDTLRHKESGEMVLPFRQKTDGTWISPLGEMRLEDGGWFIYPDDYSRLGPFPNQDRAALELARHAKIV